MTIVPELRQPATDEMAIRRLLIAADEAFVPPLTADSRAAISRPGDERGPTSIEDYVAACLDRPLLGAVEDGRLVGFCSFEPRTDGGPLADYTPTNHVEVLVVDEAYRNHGIATGFYRHLLSSLPPAFDQPAVSTKTWSTNEPHLAILESLSFDCVHRVVDDRKPGVDTVYYARRTE